MSRSPRRPPTAPLPLPFRTYGDVEAAGLEISVTCSKCSRSVLIDAGDEAMRDRRLTSHHDRIVGAGFALIVDVGHAPASQEMVGHCD
jgi:hypothetical protein